MKTVCKVVAGYALRCAAASALGLGSAQCGERVVYEFKYQGDGAQPNGGLVKLGGAYYGTAVYSGPNGPGVVFKVDPSGAETVVHAFSADDTGPDGASPSPGLLDVHGTLYGTTLFGGGSTGCNGGSCGTVYSVTPSGEEHVVYAFQSFADGAEPASQLILSGGLLYGTTAVGGASGFGTGYGTVFSLALGGTETLLHKFAGGKDGYYPVGALVKYKGAFYGVTQMGGGAPACNVGCGTVFRITPDGKEKVLHAFAGGQDGSIPTAGLTELDGTFYGTTAQGGAYGWGTVFSISPSGEEKVLYSFQNGTDGALPVGALSVSGGLLYGTTSIGGGTTCDGRGCGTIYRMTPSGSESVLFRFSSAGQFGKYPQGALLIAGKSLWGVAQLGGTYDWGVVFKYTP